MLFKHDRFAYPIQELESVTTTTGRYYTVPGGNVYESITTALGRNEEKKKGLKEWANRIGEKESGRISRIAAKRGNDLHAIIEKYLDNDPSYKDSSTMPDTYGMFNKVKPVLDKGLKMIYMQEAPLFSHKYKLAGRCDCIATCLNKLTIVDFKNSMKTKKPEWIEDYFLQTTAYKLMFEEMYGDKITQLMIIIAVENADPQIFIRDPDIYINHDFFVSRL